MKSIFIKENKVFILSIALLICFGSFLRVYNINFEDFWADEMFSFWISDPSISLNETFIRAFSSGLNFFFDLFLKFFHLIFGYDVYVSRYFSYLISVISLFAFSFLLFKITSQKSVIFGLFILCINLYHLKYSLELRSYILTFLFTIIFILLNFKNKDCFTKFNFYRYFSNITIVFIMYCNHAFTILIVASFLFYKLLYFIKEKKINSYDLILSISFIIITILFLIFYYQTNLKFVDPQTLNGLSPHWLTLPKLSFYTNFYFSEFFGSRILGTIHLLILLFCVFKFKKQLFNELNIFSFFIILIFISYLIPILYGYLFGPVLLGRFLIFLLIPIICLIAHFTILIDNKFLKFTFLILVCLSTSLNHLIYENFFREYNTKPQLRQSLEKINNSDTKILTISMLKENFNKTNDVYENYVLKYLEKKDMNIKYYNNQKDDFKPKKTWVLYFKDISDDEFKITNDFDDYKIEKKVQLNRLDLMLIKKK